MIEIKAEEIKNCSVEVPGSKSCTHRTLIAAALSNGECVVRNGLKSEDTELTTEALRKMGIEISESADGLVIKGGNGIFSPFDAPIYLGNSGTSMRLLTGVVALGRGLYTLTGTNRMKERPIQDLLDALNQLGCKAFSVNRDGCPPVSVPGGGIRGGSVEIKCGVSSQFLSSLLLMAPCTEKGLDISVVEGPVSRPYLDLTVEVMSRFGIVVNRDGYMNFQIPGGQEYVCGDYTVEPDASQASYFWGAAAVTGKTVKVKHMTRDSSQGDVGFAEVLGKMGCEVSYDSDGIAVTGKPLKGIEVDMSDMPDVVPTLAVVASFADGETVVRNVAHLKEKECDRLGCVAAELIKMGVDARATDDGLIIKGGSPSGSTVKTYDDHRMAMSFAVAGLVVPGVLIEDEMCVGKSFPNYWDVFETLYA